jgi:peptide/nickel transport system ATP-binding protein
MMNVATDNESGRTAHTARGGDDDTRAVLRFRDFHVRYGSAPDSVRGIDLTVRPGEIVGLIGESGSGKTSVAMACLGLLPTQARVEAARFEVCGTDLGAADPRTLTRLRGGAVAMVFQAAMGALDPTMRIGRQIGEVVARHRDVKGAQRDSAVLDLLRRVRVPEPERRIRQYPHQLSGGLRQRVAIALALAGAPQLLLADEPTTALDVTVQTEILRLLRTLRDELGVGILLISHDIGVIAQTADRVAVMRGGEIVEHGAAEDVLLHPVSEYTRMLLAAQPKPAIGDRRAGADPQPLFTVDGVSRIFRSRGRTVAAVRDVSLQVYKGEVLGVVGESGSGKSTLARMLVRLDRPSRGRLEIGGTDYARLRGARLRAFRRAVQMVFQHPAGSLNPVLRVGTSIREPLSTSGLDTGRDRERVAEVLAEVGLPATATGRLPHEFSGGQQQRIAIARAIAARPEVVVLDEPTSALDVSVQAQVLDVLLRVQRAEELTYVFISHDLTVVRAISDRVVVMFAGRVVEIAGAASLFESSAHWYTRALLAAVPSTDPRQRAYRVVSGAPAPASRAPTLSPFDVEREQYTAAAYEQKQRMAEQAFHRLGEAVRRGVTVALGTDSGVGPHARNLREPAHLVRIGLSPLQAIRAGTLNAARLLGLDGSLGTVEPGKIADLVVCEEDPLADIGALGDPAKVVLVMQEGRLVKNTLGPGSPAFEPARHEITTR